MTRAIAGRRSDAVALPKWILPQLTQLVDAAPEGDDWLHEIKFDGYRMRARLDRGAVKLLPGGPTSKHMVFGTQSDSGDDLVGIGGPDEGFGIIIGRRDSVNYFTPGDGSVNRLCRFQ